MYRAVLALLVGLMLSLGGGAGALTFGKDGKQINQTIPDHQTPSELLEPLEPIGRLLVGKNLDSLFPPVDWKLAQWNRCALVANNINFLVNFCGVRGETRKKAMEVFKNNVLDDFKCGSEGKEYVGNWAAMIGFRNFSHNCTEEIVKFTLDEYARLEKIIQGGVSAKFASASTTANSGSVITDLNEKALCKKAKLPSTFGGWQPINGAMGKYVTEAKRRGLSCGVDESRPTQFATNSTKVAELPDRAVCHAATTGGRWETRPNYLPHVREAKRRGLTCGVAGNVSAKFASASSTANSGSVITDLNEKALCKKAKLPSTFGGWQPINGAMGKYVTEAKRRGLSCGVDESRPTQVVANSSTNAELMAAQMRAAELEKQLALLQAKEELIQRQIASDIQAPLLTIIQSGANGREGYLTGSVTDNVRVAEVLVDGTPVSISKNGSFEWTGFVPAMGKDVVVEAIDTAALSSRQIVRLKRSQALQKGILRFDGLNPMSGQIAQANKNALALIVGISEYDRTNAPAIFADNDAQFFQDYAALKLGIPENNITTLLNADAGQVDVLLSVQDWLSRAVKQEKSDIYIFFAGHGLASDDGEKAYLLPYDGSPRLLSKTALLRDELFSDIAAANPRSVTVFLDTCYSGTTRGPDMLIASRPIAIRAKEQAVPEGFTVMTAAAGDQTAKPLEEAKHGMFSYFLMKGMEGDADANQDNQITAGELHAYVQQNVIQQSSGSQTPELQGDADRVLVRFQ